MLDIRFIKENEALCRQRLAQRGRSYDEEIDRILALDEKRRALIATVEEKKAEQNRVSKRIPQMKKAGEDVAPVLAEMKAIAEQVKGMDAQLSDIEQQLRTTLLEVPNVPAERVPVGADDSDNPVLRTWGEPTAFPFEPQAHRDIGDKLGILDPGRTGKVTGSRFHFYRGLGARLERAVINYYLDTHTSRGYTEILPPFLANSASMTGTGQLPKFEDDAYKVDKDTFLIPTAEVPVTNMYREMILDGAQLPIRHCAYSTCFRAEAGSAGRDTRGLIRQHQFNKVEMVKITKPEQSYDELESMTAEAEKVLQMLGLPYRVVTLCTGDMGFSAAKTYDIEVWMPSYGRYVEISSCSNCEDFQARRAGIRYRENPKAKPQFTHTLNGSGVAVGRTVAAILENYQNEDGTVTVPEVLRPYMGTDIIK